MGEGLAVEQHERPGDAVGEGQGVVVQAALENPPSLAVGQRLAGPCRWPGGDADVAGQAAVAGPCQEGAGVRGPGWVGGDPAVDVGLCGAGEVALVSGEPAGEFQGDPDAVRAPLSALVLTSPPRARRRARRSTCQVAKARSVRVRSAGCPARSSPSQDSMRASRSGRAGSTPASTSMARRCSREPLAGLASSSSWVSGWAA
jgi:hypothetical protein